MKAKVSGAAVAALLVVGLSGCADGSNGPDAADGAGAAAAASESNGGGDGSGGTRGAAAAEPDAEVPAIAGPARDMCGEDMVAAMEAAGYDLSRRDDATGYCDFEHPDGQLVLLMNDPLLQYEPIHAESRLMSAHDELDDGIRATVWAVPDRGSAMYEQCLAGETADDGTMQYLLYTVFGGTGGARADAVCRDAANLYAGITGG